MQALIIMNNLKKLLLHDFHLQNSAKFTNFANWDMPLSYGSSVTEHMNVRNKVGFFDVSHMGEFIVQGPEALEFLNFAFTADLSQIADGQAIYTLMCMENGGVIDDLIAYRISREEFLLCVNASNSYEDFLHLSELGKLFDCSVLDVSCDYGLIAIQGPSTIEFLEENLGDNFSSIERMFFVEKSFWDTRCYVARTGYTGEDGFEIFLPTEIVYKFAKLITQGIIDNYNPWVGVAARDSLRLEAGFCLHGNEISKKITPVEARLMWTVSFDKGEFVGKKALLNQLNTKDFGMVFHYEVNERRIPRSENLIFCDEDKAGRVLSGGYSPLTKTPIGTAYIEKDFLGKRTTSSRWFADVRGNFLPIKFTKPVLKTRQS